MADIEASEVPMESTPELKPAADPVNEVSKRAREEDDEELGENGEKKAKIEVENSVSLDTNGKKDEKESIEVSVGPKKFGSSVEMYEYFFKILHTWPTNLDLNKYENTVLLELLKKGHVEAERKIGTGIKTFQIRSHHQFKSRCFFLVRDDGSFDDFSFRKCVDHISPLPENMHANKEVNQALRGRGGFRGRGSRGHGRGRGRN